MTVSTTSNRIVYTGNGVTTAFAFPYKFIATADLKVYVAGVLQASGYTVGTPSDTGANVTFSAAPANGAAIVILSDPARLQSTSLPSTGPFPAKAVETMSDKLTLLVQRLYDLASRSLTLSDADSSTASTTLPTPAASNLIGWNESGNGLQNVPIASLATAIAYGTARSDIFTGDGTTKTFTLSASPGAQANLDVAIAGVTQLPGTDYTWSTGTSLVFTSAPPNGAKILARYMQGLAQGTSDSGSAAFIQAGTGAVQMTAQDAIRERVTVKQFGAVADWNGSTGTDNASAFLAAITYAHQNRKRLVIPAGRYSLGASGLAYTSSVINYLEIYFEAGVELVCTYSGATYPFILNLNGVGAGVKIVGNGAQLTYANAPSSRGTNHAVYLFGAGATITDLLIQGLVINNSANFGIAVYAGPTGGVSSGNKDVWIVDCVTKNTKGDGIHVENFDSGVHIVNPRIESPGDDSVCVSNYTGASGAPTKSTPTTDVEIANVHSISAYSAVVRLLGVQRCSVSKLRGTLGNSFGGYGASAVSCDETTGNYAAGNYDVVVSDVEVSGGAGLFYWSAGAIVTNFKMVNATQKQGNNYGIRALASTPAGAKLNNLTFENIHIERATNSGAAGDYPLWATYVRSLKVRGLKVVNAPSVLSVTNSDRVDLDEIQADSSGSTGSAFNVVSNTNTKVGRLVLDGSCTFTTGATFTSNTNVWHTALWDLYGATNKLSRSGNTGVRGACQRVEASVYIGSTTAGTNAKQTFSENIYTGASYQLQATLLSDQGTRWGTTGVAADGFYVLYTDAMTGVRINYIAETNVGY